jgi:hypothetical protein
VTTILNFFTTMRKCRRTSTPYGKLKPIMAPWFSPSRIKPMRLHHFSSLFQEPVDYSIQEMLEVIYKFPRSIMDEMNRKLLKKLQSLKYWPPFLQCRKARVLGLDGLTVEFFIKFYDLLKDDLLNVVRESQRTGKVLGTFNSTFIALIPEK